MKTAILFDLDGTLMDTLGDLHASVNHTLAAFGYPGRTLEEVRCFVGIGARNLISRSLPDTADEETLDKVFAAYREYYTQHCLDNTKPFDGICEVLEALGKQYALGVVSNKPHAMTQKICARYFPGMYVMGQNAQILPKPAPDMLQKAMKELGADRCVFVGDGETDVLTAKNAGMPCLSVLWGFRDREALRQYGAEHFCENVRDIPAMIERILVK